MKMITSKYKSLRDFLHILKQYQDLKEINLPINPYLEMTEISHRTLKANGPALLFNKPKGYSIPVLCNLFGTDNRVILGMGQNNINSLRKIGKLLAFLKEPDPPQGFHDILNKIPIFKHILHMPVKRVHSAPCQEEIFAGNDVDLYKLPIMHCWPKDIAPVITWGLTITKSLNKNRQNIGIYRQQIINKNKLIVRWLANRGGALDFQEWNMLHLNKKFPITVALGSDPATLLSAVMPVPNSISEYSLSGLLRGQKTEIIKCISCDLDVPAHAEIILEGYLQKEKTALEGPCGDHTGYYNTAEHFPIFNITHITTRHNPIYHSTYSGRPPDEPAILGRMMNEIFIPILQKQFTEITDFYLPPEGCSYRIAIVTIRKRYLGHAKQIMLGIWSILSQFIYTKIIIVCDDDINARDWKDIMWAISTRFDPDRDLVIIKNTPIDYLDFASPIVGLGSKMGIDATNKWPGETQRKWGTIIKMDKKISMYIDAIWDKLNIIAKK